MEDKKETEKEVKDLDPKKDAKGGGARHLEGGTSADRPRRNTEGGGGNLDRGTGAN